VANATDIVKKGAVRHADEFIERGVETLAAETRFYPNAMIGTDPTGYLAKFDDTQLMTFAGIVTQDQGAPLLPISTAGDGTAKLRIQQPKFLEVALTSVAVTDIGRVVYASDDQTGSFTPGTYGNVIGTVEDVASSNIALVRCRYGKPNGDDLQVASGDGAIELRPGTVVITKGTAAALTLAAPTAGVHDGLTITIVSSTAAAHTVTATTIGFNAGNAGADVGTFAAAIGNGLTVVAYQGEWLVTNNTGVTLA
jgi:hypothetical protein